MEENAKEAAALAITSFALELYAELVGGIDQKDPKELKNAQNLLFAPANLFTSLTMAWFGADGETDAEIQKLLHLSDDDPDQLLAILAALAAQVDEIPGCELAIANALWADEGYPIYPQYLRVLKERLRTAVKQVDFTRANEARQAINAWVEEQTRSTIRGLIPPNSLPSDTRLLLVTAVYFKGAWKTPFKKAYTKIEPFYRINKPPVDVPLMRRSARCRVVDDERTNIRALAIPYVGYTIEMVILLPRDALGLPHLERELNAELLRAILKRLQRAPLDDREIFLPRFRFDATSDLLRAFQRLGVSRAFSPDLADFSGISPEPAGLILNGVLHKAVINVDEEGTVAAAATAMAVVDGAGDPTPPFRADHPFVFLIQDTSTGSVLFLGRLLDPS
jgi:serpin B